MAELDLRAVRDELLAQYAVRDPVDSQHWVASLFCIERHLGKVPDAKCLVVRLRARMKSERALAGYVDGRERGEIDNIMQGRSGSYPGDAHVVDENIVTVQIHRVHLKRGPSSRDEIVFPDVPVLALHLPEPVIKEFVAQV